MRRSSASSASRRASRGASETRAPGSSGSGGNPLPGTRNGAAPAAARDAHDVREHGVEPIGELVRRPEARGIERDQEDALVVWPRICAHGARTREDARERLDEQREREALRAAERLQQPVAHPFPGHRHARVLEHPHLAERRDARRQVDDEVRRPGARDSRRERVRGEPPLEPARGRDALLGAGVVGEREQRDPVAAGAVGVVGEAAAVPRVPHRGGGDPVLARPLGDEIDRKRADHLAERMASVDGQRGALVTDHLGAGRGHDRARPPAFGVLHEAAQAMRRMAADLGAHEQLRHAPGVAGARAHALGGVAGETHGVGCGDLGHEANHA